MEEEIVENSTWGKGQLYLLMCSHQLLFLVLVYVMLPKKDVRRAPVPEASICCTGEIVAMGLLSPLSPILTTCQTWKKKKTHHITPCHTENTMFCS